MTQPNTKQCPACAEEIPVRGPIGLLKKRGRSKMSILPTPANLLVIVAAAMVVVGCKKGGDDAKAGGGSKVEDTKAAQNPCLSYTPEGKAASGQPLTTIRMMDEARASKWLQHVPKDDIPPLPAPPETKPGATAFKNSQQEDYEKAVNAHNAAVKRLQGKLRNLRSMFDPTWGTALVGSKDPSELTRAVLPVLWPTVGCQVVEVTGGCEKACWESYCARTESDGRCLSSVRKLVPMSKCTNSPSMHESNTLCTATAYCLADPKTKSEAIGLEYEAGLYGLRTQREYADSDAAGKATFQKAIGDIQPGDTISAEGVSRWTFETSKDLDAWVATTKEFPAVTAQHPACRAYKAAQR